jgi:hypothetical protein
VESDGGCEPVKEDATMKRIYVLAALAATIVVLAGCSQFSTVNPRAMTVDDIITMSKAGAGNEVIKDQILSTRSRFVLTTQDIIRLTTEGVADDVLRAMIESGDRPNVQTWNDGYPPYDPFLDTYGWNGYPRGYPFYDLNWSYSNPYMVYREPGLIGRFYSSYPAPFLDGYGVSPYRWRYEATEPDSTARQPRP